MSSPLEIICRIVVDEISYNDRFKYWTFGGNNL